MESHAKLFGHPIHPMLIVFPLGLLSTSLLFDIIHLVTGNPMWAEHSYVCIGAGIIMGLVAAIFGAIDWAAIPQNTRAKSIGTMHGVGNVVVIALFIASWYLRRDVSFHIPSGAAVWLSVISVSLALVTGWLGGELVDRLGVGVDDGANLNAPNSLTGEPRRGAHA